MNEQWFNELAGKDSFQRKDFFEAVLNEGENLSEIALKKRLKKAVDEGLITRAGRNQYCISKTEMRKYSYSYSEQACEVAGTIQEIHPYLDFLIFETVQLNEFVNHQIAHNVIFVYVEDDISEFVFDTLKEAFPGKVLIKPSSEIYHQYWTDNMIVITKLISETPKCKPDKWHVGIEVVLVNLLTEPLLRETISCSEHKTIFETAFQKYVIDERSLFRYARRRGADRKIREFIEKKTDIILNSED